MTESYAEGIFYRLTKDEILAGANQLGISEKQLADDSLGDMGISSGTTGWSDSVYLIKEDDARAGLFSLLKDLPDSSL